MHRVCLNGDGYGVCVCLCVFSRSTGFFFPPFSSTPLLLSYFCAWLLSSSVDESIFAKTSWSGRDEMQQDCSYLIWKILSYIPFHLLQMLDSFSHMSFTWDWSHNWLYYTDRKMFEREKSDCSMAFKTLKRKHVNVLILK